MTMAKKITETVDSKVRTSWQVLSRMYNAQASQYGATMAIVHFLLNIDSHEGSYASDIAPRLGMEGSSLSRIIQTLENEKLIIRKSDNTDKRKVRLVLTEKGKQYKELAKSHVREFNMLLEEKIGKKRIEDFYKTITEITNIAEERRKQF
jgi:MarR family transcriptional regulator, organic hydroperoxide resistance regulator